MRTPRFQAAMLGWLAAVAMFLAAVGIYSVVAFSTGQRVREIGLRMALGAPARVVVWQMTRQGATPAAAGILAGLLGALGLSRFLEAHLFEVSRLDPLVYAGVLTISLSVSLMASWIPARRAAQVDPIAALRQG